MRDRFHDLGLEIPRILLPQRREADDLTRWAVIACDQYTSQPAYWEAVAREVGDAPSTLQLIYPEAFLGAGPDRIPDIQEAMRRYLRDGVLEEAVEGFVYVERRTARATRRRGLVAAIDLERYAYEPGNAATIRATEGTIAERLPPRVRVRFGAALELPHVLLLIDDPDRTVVEPLTARREAMRALYDGELMLGGGHVSGWAVEGEALGGVLEALEALRAGFSGRYGAGIAPMLFAVGDGNHSLASARECWRQLREMLPPDARENHPARYALVEIINVHDEGLTCEGIHRIVTGVDAEALSARVESAVASLERDASAVHAPDGERTRLALLRAGGRRDLHVATGAVSLVAAVQACLDDFLAAHVDARIDYIHGLDALEALSARPGCLGIAMPDMDKRELFPAVLRGGVLPRKMFSLGEADEKRFYIECRAIGDA